jgi:hypothetical protein
VQPVAPEGIRIICPQAAVHLCVHGSLVCGGGCQVL